MRSRWARCVNLPLHGGNSALQDFWVVVCDFPILGGRRKTSRQLLDRALAGCAPKQVDRNDFTRCRNLLSTR